MADRLPQNYALAVSAQPADGNGRLGFLGLVIAWSSEGNPIVVDTHDLIDPAGGKLVELDAGEWRLTYSAKPANVP